MGKRIASPSRGRKVYTTNDYDYDVTATDLTSQDVVYSTESSYAHDKAHKDYKDYYETDEYDSSKLFDHYDDDFDYTTSGVSYDDREAGRIQQPVRREQLNPKQKYHHEHTAYYNPEGNDYLSSDEFKVPRKFRARWTKPNYVNYNVNVEKDQPLQREHTVLVKRREYDSLIKEHEKDYKNHHESSKPKEKTQYKYKYKHIEDESVEEDVSPKKHYSKGYRILAFQDPKLKKIVAKGQPVVEETSQQSEVETQNHEYPVLAFKNAGKGKQEMVYLPLLVMDERSFKNKLATKSNTKNVPGDNFQVYAANLEGQQNIFQRLSSVKPQNESDAHPQEKVSIPPDLMYAGSFIQSMIDEAPYNKPPLQESLDGNDNVQRSSFPVDSKYPLTYQVDVDISPEVNKNSVKSEKNTISNIRQSGQLKESEYAKAISESLTKKSMISRRSHDPLEDSYPVKKDYIKVSSSTQPRSNTQSIATHQTSLKLATEKHLEENTKLSNPNSLAMTPSVLIDIERITQEIENSKNNQPTQSIIKQVTSQASNLDTHEKSNPQREHSSANVLTTRQQNTKLCTVKEEESKEMNELPFVEQDSNIRLDNRNRKKTQTFQSVPKASHTQLTKNKSESSLVKLNANQPIYFEEELTPSPHDEKSKLKKRSYESLNQFKSQYFSLEENEEGSEMKAPKDGDRKSQEKKISMTKNDDDIVKPQSKNSIHQKQSQFGGDNEYIQHENEPIPLSKKGSRASVVSILRKPTGGTKKSTGLKKLFTRSSVASIPENSTGRTKSKGKKENCERSNNNEEQPTEYRESTSRQKPDPAECENTQSRLPKPDSKAEIGSGRKSTGIKKLFSRSRSKNEETGDEAEPKKSRSFLGILRRGIEGRRSQQSLKKSASKDSGYKNTNPTNENPKWCVASYIVNLRECANFFLGTNLYQSTTNILSLF